MQMTNRNISVSASYIDHLFQITVHQIDTLYTEPVKEYCISMTGHFDDDLYLRAIRVNELRGSKGSICAPAKDSAQALIGIQVGNGFNKAVEKLQGPFSCMHFTVLLQLMASTVVRCRQIGVYQAKGEIAFLESNKAFFDGKCVGYSNDYH